jgi:hypothetical protein
VGAFVEVESKVVLGRTGEFEDLARGFHGSRSDIHFVDVVRLQKVQESSKWAGTECGLERERVESELDCVKGCSRRCFGGGYIIGFVIDDGDSAIRIFEPQVDRPAHESAIHLKHEFPFARESAGAGNSAAEFAFVKNGCETKRLSAVAARLVRARTLVEERERSDREARLRTIDGSWGSDQLKFGALARNACAFAGRVLGRDQHRRRP